MPIVPKNTVWVKDCQTVRQGKRPLVRFSLTNGREVYFPTYKEGLSACFRAGICVLGAR